MYWDLSDRVGFFWFFFSGASIYTPLNAFLTATFLSLCNAVFFFYCDKGLNNSQLVIAVKEDINIYIISSAADN